MSADLDTSVDIAAPNETKPKLNGFYGSADAVVRDTVARRSVHISTVSHTLEASLADRLRSFAFHERMSESAVIEYALLTFFGSGDTTDLGQRLRDAGATRRRRI